MVLGITRQARHYLYEAANVLLTTVKRPSALKSWGLKRMKRRGPKRARVAVVRRLTLLLGGSGKIKPTSTLCLRNGKGYPRRIKTPVRRTSERITISRTAQFL